MKFKEYLPFYKRNLKVALPVMITQAGQIVVQLADNIMVGHLGAAPLAGVAFASAIVTIGLVFAIGFSQGITPMVGQSFGKQDYGHVSTLLSNAALLNGIMTVVLMVIMLSVGACMDYMGQDPEVLQYAKQYYFITVLSLIPMILFLSIRFFSEGVGNTKNAMMITIVTNLLNVFLNWVLIYGKWGAPEMGVSGAAFATLISRVLSGGAFLVLLFTVDEYSRYIRIMPKHPISRIELKHLLGLSLPISMQSLLEVTAFAFAAIFVGWMGTYELAAHQITQSLSQLSFLLATGIGAAATIRVSHQFGSGNYRGMYMAGKASIHMAILLMSVFGILYFIFRERIPFLYTEDLNVVPIAAKTIVVLALFQIFDAVQLASMSSLRGLKDIKIPLLFSAISYYGLCLPSAYLLGFVFGLGPVGVWIGLLIGLGAASVFFYTRFNRQCRKYIAAESGCSEE